MLSAVAAGQPGRITVNRVYVIRYVVSAYYGAMINADGGETDNNAGQYVDVVTQEA